MWLWSSQLTGAWATSSPGTQEDTLEKDGRWLAEAQLLIVLSCLLTRRARRRHCTVSPSYRRWSQQSPTLRENIVFPLREGVFRLMICPREEKAVPDPIWKPTWPHSAPDRAQSPRDWPYIPVDGRESWGFQHEWNSKAERDLLWFSLSHLPPSKPQTDLSRARQGEATEHCHVTAENPHFVLFVESSS